MRGFFVLKRTLLFKRLGLILTFFYDSFLYLGFFPIGPTQDVHKIWFLCVSWVEGQLEIASRKKERKMNKLYGFLFRKEMAPYFFAICLFSTGVSLWLCKINYQTTYTELNGLMPYEAALVMTMMVQAFELVIPALSLLGIMNALDLELRIGLTIGWIALLIIDSFTAYEYFIGYYPHPAWNNIVLSIALSLIFLIGEILVMLSIYGMIASINFWRFGSLPEWLTQSSPMPKRAPVSDDRPVKRLRTLSDGEHVLFEMASGRKQAYSNDDPAIAGY